jgi:hypothetical protein
MRVGTVFFLVMATWVPSLSGCTDDPSDTRRGGLVHERLTAEGLREMTGVSALPRPVDQTALLRAVARHYPPDLRGRGERALVLVEALIDASGRVTDVEVVQPPAGDVHHRAVVVTRDPSTGRETQRTLADGGPHNAAFGPAAQAAVREVRFTPAMRDDQAVPFRMRMSVEFTP